jgi:hypothetical protein
MGCPNPGTGLDSLLHIHSFLPHNDFTGNFFLSAVYISIAR